MDVRHIAPDTRSPEVTEGSFAESIVETLYRDWCAFQTNDTQLQQANRQPFLQSSGDWARSKQRTLPADELLNDLQQRLQTHLEEPWFNLTIQDNPQSRVNLLYLPADARIPLHDHPGREGISTLLIGCIEVIAYSAKQSYSATSRRVILISAGIQHCISGDQYSYTRDERNLHSLHALQPSTVLNIQSKSASNNPQALFFPVATETEGEQLFQRIPRPDSQPWQRAQQLPEEGL